MERKQLRLKNWNYGNNGTYFITICVKDRKHLFGPVGADSISAQMINRTFNEVIEKYSNVYCSKYVIIPNHFHAIIHIERADMESAPTVSKVIQEFKRYSTIEYIKLVKQNILPAFEKQLWQRSYYDHIIRNQQDYEDAWNYIEGNPTKWHEDELY